MVPFTHTFTFRITLTDAYDGILRVLIDAQRLGLELVALDLQPGRETRCMTMTMTVSAAVPVDGQLLATRFARHPVVSQVEVPDESDRDHVCAADTANVIAA
jgi:hypothetical protein